MSLHETIKDSLDAMSDGDVTKELTEYLESRKELDRMKIKVGELVHYSDDSCEKAVGNGWVGALTGLSPDGRYIVNGSKWKYISRLITTPNVRIPVNVTECPDHLKGKAGTFWRGDTYSVSVFDFGDGWDLGSYTHYLITGDSDD